MSSLLGHVIINNTFYHAYWLNIDLTSSLVYHQSFIDACRQLAADRGGLASRLHTRVIGQYQIAIASIFTTNRLGSAFTPSEFATRFARHHHQWVTSFNNTSPGFLINIWLMSIPPPRHMFRLDWVNKPVGRVTSVYHHVIITTLGRFGSSPPASNRPSLAAINGWMTLAHHHWSYRFSLSRRIRRRLSWDAYWLLWLPEGSIYYAVIADITLPIMSFHYWFSFASFH